MTTTALKELFNHRTAAFAAVPEDTMKLRSADQVMPVFKWKNSAKFGALDADAQWFSMLRSTKMGRVGRQRVAAWEAQNLPMAIREATTPIAGGRALLVVGAAHKPFIEAYLRSFTDVEIVSVPALLASQPGDFGETDRATAATSFQSRLTNDFAPKLITLIPFPTRVKIRVDQ